MVPLLLGAVDTTVVGSTLPPLISSVGSELGAPELGAKVSISRSIDGGELTEGGALTVG